MNADPSLKAKRAETCRNWSPEMKAKKAAHLRTHYENMTPAEREQRRQWGLHLVENVLARPEVAEKRVKAYPTGGAKRTRTMLPWCPPERVADYRNLLNKHYSAAEAKALILKDIEGAERREARRAVRRAAEQMREREARRIAQAY